MDRESSPELLERDRELQSIRAALDACFAGDGSFVVVEGPAGIGKSALLAAGRARAEAAGMTVLRARGNELERAFAYGVMRQLFERVITRTEAAERAELFREAAAHAERIFDPKVDDPPALGDDAFALVHGLYWLTVNISESGPLLILIDDLHWADTASLRSLGYLTRRIDGHSICVLAASRSADEDPLFSELLADRATSVVRLNTLSTGAVASLVRSVVGEHAEERFSLACHAATGGNPLLVHELLRTVAAEGLPPTAASASIVASIAPDAVSRSVNVRLSRLSNDAKAVASAVAVLGDGADPAHLAQIAGVDSTGLAVAVAALAHADLLAKSPPTRFVYPLVRNAVYERTTPDERLRHHARAAALLASTGAPKEAIAAQLLHAPPRAVPSATEILGEAARQASARGAPESAATYLSRALEEPLEHAQRVDLLLELAEAEFSVGRASLLAHLREALALVPAGARRTVIRLKLARALFWWRRPDEAIELLEHALAEESAVDDQTRRLEADLIAVALRSRALQTTVQARLDALELDRPHGPADRLLLGLRAYADATHGTQRLRAVADAEQALAGRSREGERPSLAYGPAMFVLLFADRFDELLRHVDAATEEARERGHAFAFANASVFRARVQYLRAELHDAEADARLALDALPARNVVLAPYVVGTLAEVLVERGAYDEAAGRLHRFDLASLDELSKTPLLRARAAVAAARGDHRSALADALHTGEILNGLGQLNPAVSSWRTDAALAYLFLGLESDARGLARRELELARTWGAPRALGRALRVLGLIESGDDGVGHLRQAVEILEGSPARLEYLYALTQLGSALRRANQRAAAREILRNALDLAQRGGATRIAELAHAELIASGARPRRRRLTGLDALTPSERRVAEMGASGRSNREIAQALFVTLRTVEMHLSSTFRKLGVTARSQLPAALAVTGGRAARR